MQGKIENKGEAWSLMLKDVKAYFDRVNSTGIDVRDIEDIPLFERRKINELDNELVDLVGYQTLKNVQKNSHKDC